MPLIDGLNWNLFPITYIFEFKSIDIKLTVTLSSFAACFRLILLIKIARNSTTFKFTLVEFSFGSMKTFYSLLFKACLVGPPLLLLSVQMACRKFRQVGLVRSSFYDLTYVRMVKVSCSLSGCHSRFSAAVWPINLDGSCSSKWILLYGLSFQQLN